jgi:ribosomal-protein-alanine N-acetyltransferase
VTTEARGTLLVRRAAPEDLAQIAEIEAASFADPWTVEAFASSLAFEQVRFFVAEERSEDGAGGCVLLGYVVALVMADEGEIANLAVSPAARRRGLGGLLLDRATAEVVELGVRALYLEVRESNVAARALYESKAFRPVGRRRAYYRNPLEDALLLRRDLVPT